MIKVNEQSILVKYDLQLGISKVKRVNSYLERDKIQGFRVFSDNQYNQPELFSGIKNSKSFS